MSVPPNYFNHEDATLHYYGTSSQKPGMDGVGHGISEMGFAEVMSVENGITYYYTIGAYDSGKKNGWGTQERRTLTRVTIDTPDGGQIINPSYVSFVQQLLQEKYIRFQGINGPVMFIYQKEYEYDFNFGQGIQDVKDIWMTNYDGSIKAHLLRYVDNVATEGTGYLSYCYYVYENGAYLVGLQLKL